MSGFALQPQTRTAGHGDEARTPPFDPSAFVRRTGSQSRLCLHVTGARCGGCLSKIETAVRALPGVVSARLNLSTGKLDILWSGSLDARRISNAVVSLGFGVSASDTADGEVQRRDEERRLLTAMGIAAFAAANIMLLSIPVWFSRGEMGAGTRQVFHAISALIALPAIAISGQPFFASALQALAKRRANMDVPISLAIILATSVSVHEMLTGGEHAYFDAACMLLFFLLIGRFLEARVRRRAFAAAHQLAALTSRSVTRIDADGCAQQVKAGDIRPGDRVLLAPGERAAVNLKIESGISEIDESSDQR